MASRLAMSSTYHPQTDGQSERTIQSLEDLLRTCVLLRLWQVYQVVQVVTGKTGISFPKRLVYTK